MKLTDLEPEWITYNTVVEMKRTITDEALWKSSNCALGITEALGPVHYRHHPLTLAEAQGIIFLCPKCMRDHPDGKGVHSVEVSFRDRGVLDADGTHTKEGLPVRWQVSGTGFHDLTTTPSILLTGAGCGWHGYLQEGNVSII